VSIEIQEISETVRNLLNLCNRFLKSAKSRELRASFQSSSIVEKDTFWDRWSNIDHFRDLDYDVSNFQKAGSTEHY
jgi:hypothetical protein